jgi:hypothetical protein
MTGARRLTAVVLLAWPTAALAEPSLSIVPLGFKVEHLRGPATRVALTIGSLQGFGGQRAVPSGPVAVVWGRDGAAILFPSPAGVRVLEPQRPGVNPAVLERGHGGVPDARVAGTGALSAEFETATSDYPHSPLGSPIQGTVLAIEERTLSPPTGVAKPVERRVTRIPASEGAAFEDREPHLVASGSGEPVFAVVQSYKDRGAALLVVGKREGQWTALAETSPDGEPERWLNPVSGSAGTDDVAIVRRPDRDGLLQVWRLERGALSLRAEKSGYSNHAPGSASQDLSVWFRAPDGSPSLAIPTIDRTHLALLKVGAGIVEVGRVPLPAKASSGVASLGSLLLVGLEDGRVVAVQP